MENDNNSKKINAMAIMNETLLENGQFDFLKSFVEHIKVIFGKFSKRKILSEVENDEFISHGRTEEEKEAISEMCDKVDEEYSLLIELRSSQLTPEDWLQKKTDEILQDNSLEEKEDIMQLVQTEEEAEIMIQAEALDNVVNDLQEDVETK